MTTEHAGGDAPPTSPDGTDLPPDPPRWPSVIGGISIGVGAFWLLCGGCGIGYFAFLPQISKMAEQQIGGPMPSIMYPPLAQYVVMGIGLLLDVLLIVGGIATIRREPSGRTMHLAYGVLGSLVGLAGAAFGYMHTVRVDAYFRQNPDDPWASQNNPAMSLIMVAAFTILGLAWPVFCLIWFGAVKRDRASMTGGAGHLLGGV